MFKKILVPLDGSELSEWALEPALKMAETVRGEVILLRCAIPVYMTAPVVALEYEWAWPEYAREEIRLEARDYLDDVRERFSIPGVRLETMDVEGDAASMIVDTAIDEDVDLIVMSTHGWSGFKKWMFGSVTERVLNSGSCPVLAIHSPQPINRVAITLDGSPLAEEALEPGLDAAAGLGAGVTLLRVSEPLPAGLNPSMQFNWEVGKDTAYQIGQQTRQEAENYLHEVARRVARHDLDIQYSVVEGQPVDKILEFANLRGVDMISMCTHGRTGLRRWLFGSVTSKVMHSFSGHMLIVRA